MMNTNIKTGLNSNEVKDRINKNLINYDTTTPSKSIKQIIKENTITLFNIINIILGIAIILVGSYKNLLFLGVVICNTLISTVQEIRAKKIVDKLSIISSSKAKVIRNEKQVEININEVVLNDIIIYELGNQIITDSVIREGTCEVDESFITGESKTIFKKEGDMLLSGSFIVSGGVIAEVKHVALDNYTSVISKDAKYIKEINSEIMRSLNKIVKYISFALVPIGILLLIRQFSIAGNTTQNAVVTVVAAVIGMIPEGLILLVSTVLAISVMRLSKYNVLVQDLYCIETLARVDTLCLDKTGTITEGIMEISDVIPLDNHKMNDIETALSALSTSLNDKNPTFKAINDKYGNSSLMKAKKTISFSSERKFSGAIYDDVTYIMGAPEFVLKDNIDKYNKEIENASNNSRVLVLVSTTDNIKDSNMPDNIVVLALILIKDKIRKEAINTLRYFTDNDVELKVISGDSVSTVSNVAKAVGIDVKGVCDARKITKETDLNELVEETTVFARVKPDQKKLLISAMKNNGHIVAMTGDGVNDVLALKEADCSVVMSSGSDAARNVAELVLLDSNFDSMPKIVQEGRRTINNVERSATLFLSKTIYASLLALLFLFINYTYPFIPVQMSLISSLTIGFPGVILALESNHDRVKGSFLINVISKSIPSGITTVINILLLVFFATLFKLDPKQVSTMAVIITGYTAILLIYRISKPLNLLRKSLLILIVILFVSSFFIPFFKSWYTLEFLTPNSLLLLLPLMYISTKLFVLFSKLLNIVIKKKSKWFI